MSILSERDRSLLWEDVIATPDGKPLQTLGEVLDALQVAWEQNADMLAACKAAVEYVGKEIDSYSISEKCPADSVWDTLNAAIAKAEPNPIT
jgi:hypothetical protein